MNIKLNSLSLKGMRKHTALIPLVVFTAVGMFGAFGYLARLALRHPDINYDKSRPNPFERNDPTYQYKFYSPLRDYSKEKHASERPAMPHHKYEK